MYTNIIGYYAILCNHYNYNYNDNVASWTNAYNLMLSGENIKWYI